MDSGDARALSFSGIVSFGDSYTDTGNNGRGAEGPVWIELVAGALGVPQSARPLADDGQNFARGGGTAAGVTGSDLRWQLASYHYLHPVTDPDALYVFWIGHNDVSQAPYVFDLRAYSTSIVDVIEAQMLGLHAEGARHFLVPNLWDRLVTPLSYYEDSDADRARYAALTQLINTKLAAMLDDFPGYVYELDAFGLSRALHADPEAYGFHKGRYGICGWWKDYCPGYIYRDRFHPTSKTQWLIAQSALQAIPEPGTGLLLAIGLIGLSRVGRRRSR